MLTVLFYNVIGQVPHACALEVEPFTMKKIDTDMNYVKDLYLSEKSVDQIATIIGVKKGVVEQRARESGLLFSALRPPISPSRGVLKIDIPEDDIIALFESG